MPAKNCTQSFKIFLKQYMSFKNQLKIQFLLPDTDSGKVFGVIPGWISSEVI